MLILLSPSKTIRFTPTAEEKAHTMPLFNDEAQDLIEQLNVYTVEEIQQKEKVSLNLARSTYEYIQSFSFSNTPQKQAVFAFNGNVYDKLDAEKFNLEELTFMQNHVRIFSALYGILKPLDLIKPYRLDMLTKLITGLYVYWKELVTQEVIKELERNNRLLINLASNEYAKMIDYKQLPIDARIITPVFQQERNGRYATNSLFAKHARGLMTRFIVENKIEEPELLKAFDKEGYFYNPHLSKENEWYFVRSKTSSYNLA